MRRSTVSDQRAETRVSGTFIASCSFVIVLGPVKTLLTHGEEGPGVSDLCRFSSASASSPSSSVASWISNVAFCPGNTWGGVRQTPEELAHVLGGVASVRSTSGGRCCHSCWVLSFRYDSHEFYLRLSSAGKHQRVCARVTDRCAPTRHMAWCPRRRPASSPTGG